MASFEDVPVAGGSEVLESPSGEWADQVEIGDDEINESTHHDPSTTTEESDFSIEDDEPKK